jgi:cytochrome c peroxidase
VRRLAAGAAALLAVGGLVAWHELRSPDGPWSAAQLRVLHSLSLASLKPARDPSNRYARDPAAARLGRALFFDPRLSANGKVSCSACHSPERGFQDGRRLGHGIGLTRRRTMAIVGAAQQTWLFWDGRKDSLWSQALGPIESPVEQGLTRVEVVRAVARFYPRAYERVFGPLARSAGLPSRASPLGDAAERRAWARLAPRDRRAVNHGFANVGKAIAAYETQLRFAPARFDRYVAGEGELTAEELAGLRLFIGEAHCVDCHSGPLFTNGEFHNTGVRPNGDDLGRAEGVEQVVHDEFNCLGPYSDAPRSACAINFVPRESTRLRGAFKPPSLRNVTRNAPYMHAGELATLGAVLRHYNRARPAAVGRSELHPLGLSDAQLASIVAFLRTLESPIVTPGG